jgi:hypothetical protein
MTINSKAMKKITSIFRNFYRVLVVRPSGERLVINSQESIPEQHDIISETYLKKLIGADEYAVDTDPELQHMLELRVSQKGSSAPLAKNSFAEIFLPVFSLKHIELKMVAVTFAVVIALGIGPAGHHSINRNLQPFFLADTLIDSSVMYVPLTYDSAPGVK